MDCGLQVLAYKLAFLELATMVDWPSVALTAIALAVIAVACAIGVSYAR
jgi:hypothetical protein